MSSNNQEYMCYQCTKKYPDFSKYQTHLKLKHHGKQSLKTTINEEEFIDIQDKIYAYLGELSQFYCQNIRLIEPVNLDQKFTGQANYLPNLIVRTPYEPQINIKNELPSNYEYTPMGKSQPSQQQASKLVQQLNSQIRQLCSKLDEERNYWQFADPLDPNINFQNQFSILDVVKLIRNYPKRNIVLKMPELTIFLVWIGRVCKVDMFKLVYQILVSHVISSRNSQRPQKSDKKSKKSSRSGEGPVQKNKNMEINEELKQQIRENQQKQKEQGQIFQNFKIKMNVNKIQLQKLQKLVQFYQLWAKTILPGIAAQKRNQQESASKLKISN